MQQAYEKVVQEHVDVPTNKQAVPYPSVAFLKVEEKLVPATPIDILLYGKDFLTTIDTMAKKVTFRHVIARSLPQMAENASLSPEEIDTKLGFSKVIRPCGEIREIL